MPILAPSQISENSFWKLEGLGRCENDGNSGNLGGWRGVESGISGNLTLKMPDLQSRGNLTLSQQKSGTGPMPISSKIALGPWLGDRLL